MLLTATASQCPSPDVEKRMIGGPAAHLADPLCRQPGDDGFAVRPPSVVEEDK